MSNKFYIFLDIDGVLNSANYFYNIIAKEYYVKENDLNVKFVPHEDGNQGDWIQIELLNNLKYIIKHIQNKGLTVEVIVVSSWCSFGMTWTQVRDFLDIPITGKSKNTGGGPGRGKAVEEFIEQHNIDKFHYAILDDSNHLYENLSIFAIDGKTGLNSYYTEAVLECIEMSDI